TEDISMWRTRRRRSTAISRRAEIGAALNRAVRQLGLAASGAAGKLRHACRNIGNDPVPPARAGRSIGIIHRDDEALGTCRRAAPGEVRREVSTGIAHAAEDLRLRQALAIGDIVAAQFEGHTCLL